MGGEELPELVEPEVNPSFYRDTESLLYRGFVVATGSFQGVRVVSKSVNHTEYDFLTLAYGEDHSDPLFQSAFIAKSLLFFGGVNVLKEDFASLVSHVATFPNPFRVSLLGALKRVNDRAHAATHLTEAYFTEKSSRWRWAQVRGLNLMDPSFTGIPGTENLGHNWAQLIWRALNQTEDAVEQVESSWDHAKFIGSCFTKLDRVYSSDARRRYDHKVARFRRKEAIIRNVVLLEPEDEAKASSVVGKIQVARDATDLAREVAKQLRGEKDFHDQVVEAAMEYQREVARAQLAQQKELERLAKERAENSGTETYVDFGRGYTLSEILRKGREEALTRIPTHNPPANPLLDPQRGAKYGLIPPGTSELFTVFPG